MLKQPQIALSLGEKEALPAHQDVPGGGVCPRCGRPTKADRPCAWHKTGRLGKREAQAKGANERAN